MKELFLPYELAVIAKEKGFRELCFALVTEKNVIQFLDTSDFEELDFDNRVTSINDTPCVPAPLYQQIVDWFRVEKLISVEVSWNAHTRIWQGVVQDIRNPINTYDDYGAGKEYYHAFNTAITEAFKLI